MHGLESASPAADKCGLGGGVTRGAVAVAGDPAPWRFALTLTRPASLYAHQHVRERWNAPPRPWRPSSDPDFRQSLRWGAHRPRQRDPTSTSAPIPECRWAARYLRASP